MVGDAANVSRELQTLVSAIRAPLEDGFADAAALPAAHRERLGALQRNVARLLQVVSALFELPEIDSLRHGNGSNGAHGDRAGTVLPRAAARADDMKERKALELRSREDQDDRREREALERANQELEAFSYSVSHDLRGPLRAVNGFSQVLLSEHAHALDHHGRELLEQIHVNARRMAALVDDLLSLSQVGRSALRRDAVDLTAIARRVVADLRLREPARNVEVSVASGLAATCDGRLVTIALENLFGNAWKFTSTRPQAQIMFDREDSRVFALRDNGVGFDMDHCEHLFEPFERLHSSSDFEGTGIGLAIVRRVIERHGGHVWAHGVVDGGATVRFTLGPYATT